MDKNTFDRIVSEPVLFSKQLRQEIAAEKSRYPFSSVLQLLDLLSTKAVEGSADNADISRTKLYLPEGCPMFRLMAAAQLEKPAEPVDILQEINSYKDVSFKTAPKSVILSKFLENQVCSDLNSADSECLPIEEIAKKSISSQESVETETLAVIFKNQGKYEKAIAIYQKLISKYPEKSSIFASRISELNILIETNKK